MPVNQKLRRKLLALSRADQAMRRGQRPWSKKADEKRARKLAQIVARYGWPDMSRVKEDGAMAAWLIAQHADFDVKLQEQFLKLLKVSARQKKVPIWQPAYLEDRVRVNKGKFQLYGTQFRLNKRGGLTMWSVQNSRRLDIRRKQVGLEPIALYKNKMRSRQVVLKWK